jgi:predicted enzyme related to lactoylglutathione lyase
MATSTDPFDALRRPALPRRVRPQFAAALRRRLEEELNMTTTTTTDVKLPDMFHIRVPNADRAMTFFGAVLDWQGERVEWEGHVRHYMTNTEGSQPVLTDEDADWAVRVGFKVDDVAATVAAIEQLGGRVTERDDRYALADDDQGVPLVVWTPGDPHPHAPPTQPARGELEWFEIRVPSAERGRDFYGQLLGWNFAQFEAGPFWHVVNDEGQSQAGITEAEGPVRVTPSATVDDIEAARQRVIAAGGQADDATPMGPGLGCECRDDQGTYFSLWAPA